MASHLLDLSGLNQESLGDQLAKTAIGRDLYATGALEGVRLAGEAIREECRGYLPETAKAALEELSRQVAQSAGVAGLGRQAERAIEPARKALRELAMSNRISEAAALRPRIVAHPKSRAGCGADDD